MEPILDHWIEFGQLIVGVVGVAFVVKQLFDVKRSLEKQDKNLELVNRGLELQNKNLAVQIETLKAQTLASIYREYFRVCRELLKRPDLRPYLYDGKRLNGAHDADSARRAEVATICELMTGVLEQAAVQRPNLPKDAWTSCWHAFVREMYRDPASEFADYYRQHRHFYATAFHDIVDPLVKPNAWHGEEPTRSAKP
jgi:hypothetical protein